jgi:hypothetical protein
MNIEPLFPPRLTSRAFVETQNGFRDLQFRYLIVFPTRSCIVLILSIFGHNSVLCNGKQRWNPGGASTNRGEIVTRKAQLPLPPEIIQCSSTILFGSLSSPILGVSLSYIKPKKTYVR